MEDNHGIDGSLYCSRSNAQHVQTCTPDCRAQFLTSLAPKVDGYGTLCQAFSNSFKDGGQGLAVLYCCGSQLCEMDVMGSADLDCAEHQQGPQILSEVWYTLHSHMLNTLVDTDLGSDGYDSVTDPASLNQAHVLSKSRHGKEHARQENATPTAALPTATPSGFLIEGFHTITSKIHPPPASEIAHGSTASESHVLHLATTTETSKPLHERARDTSKVPSGTKVTIGVSVMVGILAVVALIAWHIRIRMRLRNKKRISRPVKPSSLPPTPLISPSSSYAGPPNAPLTPPARLQERRFLLTRALSLRRNNYRRRHGDEEEPEEWSAVPLAPMPPLTPPSASRPAKRPLEEDEPGGITATTTISMTTTAPPRPPRSDIPPAGSLTSVFSRASTLRATTSNASSDSTQIKSSGVTAVELPRQPARVYETPPSIRGLASPGPPPNRALPSLPADGRRSPLRSPLASPTRPTRRASPNSGTAPPRSTLGVNEGNGGSRRKSREESGGGAGRTSGETGLSSLRRVMHVRSPLLNEVCLNSATKTE
ncbi:hypothetical protein CCMA1212_008891 [Trichoderma ghanense]|uniref:Extracellular membrane protein CFEM domain-containing protein n=1 Tax=Trichoderma ghanense TaxID=65468 RepID=A0ABY2GVB3_9HYPO